MNTPCPAAALRLLCCLVPLLALPAGTAAPAAGQGADAGNARQVLRVGPSRPLARPSQAASIARNGALVEIDAVDYVGDVAVWPQSDLTLRGVGGRARLRADGKAAQGKAIWVIQGDLVTVENLEFSGTRVPDHNGAGIRAEGAGLTIRNCRLHHNEMGLLTNHNPLGLVVIEGSELDHNTTDTGSHGKLGHNIYIGRIERFILRNSQVHDAQTGHLVKSRARRNDIYDNRILDGDGAASYLLDLAEGGQAEVAGNRFQKSATAENRTAISFAAEASDKTSGHSLRVVDNDFVNLGGPGTFVRNHSEAAAELKNNRIQGAARALEGKGRVD